MEAYNQSKNDLMRRVTKGRRVTGEVYLQISKRIEKRGKDRLYQLKQHQQFKRKNKKFLAKDKAFSTVIKEYRKGDINHDEYVRKIVKLNREEDLPGGRKALQEFLESDSDWRV